MPPPPPPPPPPPHRPCTAEWEMDGMLAWLRHVQESAIDRHGEENSAYVHRCVLTWSSQHQKNEYAGYQEDVGCRDTFQRPNKISKGAGRKVWVFLVDGPGESYVGKKVEAGKRQWDLVGWHAWAAAVVAGDKGKGRDLYLFDCDMELPETARETAAKDLRTQLQRVFVREVKKWDFSLSRVLIGNAGSGSAGKDRCLDAATRWVEQVAMAGSPGSGVLEELLAGFMEISPYT